MGRIEYWAIRPEFVLRNDGNKIILYILDLKDSRVYILNPIEGFALSMLDGTVELYQLAHRFNEIFPDSTKKYPDILEEINLRVSSSPNSIEIGSRGIFFKSNKPIEQSVKYDPKQYILSPSHYFNSINNMKERFRLNRPIAVMIFFTNKCQVNCIYCYSQRKVVKELTLDEWISILDEIKKLGIKIVIFSGGDVMAREDSKDFLIKLIERDFLFVISTKCRVSESDIEELVKAGFKKPVNHGVYRSVQLSIDAIDRDIATKITGNQNFLDNILLTFNNFIKNGIIPKIKTVVTPNNLDQPLKILKYFYEKGVRRFEFTPYFRSFYRHNDELFLNMDEARRLGTQIEDLKKDMLDAENRNNLLNYDTDANLSCIERRTRWENRKGCAGGWQSLCILPDGNVILCEQMEQDPRFYVGDLKKQTISEVWNGESMLNFIFPSIDKFKNTICYSCDKFEECHYLHGYCYRDAYFSYGTIYEAPPLCPKQTKKGLSNIIM